MVDLDTGLVLIITVFGIILAVALYFYLFRKKNGGTTKLPSSSTPTSSVSDATRKEMIMKLGEELLQLLTELEQVKEKVNDIDGYFGQKVEGWKKKIQQRPSKRE